MATEILTAAPVAETPRQYHLPEANRQALLAKSGFGNVTTEIERQRQRFVLLNGSSFGVEPTPQK